MSNRFRVLSFGEILWDVMDDREFIGGAPFNFAAHISKLGGQVFFVSRVGPDNRGKKAHKMIDKYGVEDELIQIDQKLPTGFVTVKLNDEGSPDYIIHEDVSYDHIDYNDKLENKLKKTDFDIFYFGTLAQRNKKSRQTLIKIFKNIKAKKIFLDLNLRQDFYNKQLLKSSLERTDILKLNQEELQILIKIIYDEKNEKAALEKLTEDFKLEIICVTAGSSGCIVFSQGELKTIPVEKVEVADTVGTGDAFSAGFLYNLCLKDDPFKAAYFGNEIGRLVASKRGAIPEYDICKLKEKI